jgi:hypothetical protein
MPRSEDDNEYQKTIKELQNLRKIDAPSNFEIELLRKINAGSQRKEKKSWFDIVFSPMLIPTTALTFTTMVMFLSAMIIFLLLRHQVDETGKHIQISPQLYEEKIEKQSDSKKEIQKGKVSTSDRQKIGSTPPEVISNEPEKEGKSSMDVVSPNEIMTDEEPAVQDKMEAKTSRGKSDQKTNIGGEQNFNALRTEEKGRKPIEMLKEKIDTTKDSSKTR